MLLEACTGCLWWNPIDCHLGTDGRIVSKLARAFPFPPSEVLLPSSLPREFSTAPECQSHATFPLLATWSSGGSRSGASGSGTWQDAEEGLAGALALPCRSPKHRGSLLGERSTLLPHPDSTTPLGLLAKFFLLQCEWPWMVFRGSARHFCRQKCQRTLNHLPPLPSPLHTPSTPLRT